MITFGKLKSLSERKTISGRFSIDWTKTFEEIKIPHRKPCCLDCDNKKVGSVCVSKPKKNCFICDLERDCEKCLDQISQIKTYSTDDKLLNRKSANEHHQKLPFYRDEYERRQVFTVFESTKEFVLEADKKMIVTRRLERINRAIKSMAYTKNEAIRKNKQVFCIGFKHTKTDKAENYIIIGCKSDDFYKIDKIFSFWSNRFINKEIEMKNFEITGWSFMTLVRTRNF